MSVIVTMVFQADPEKLEHHAVENKDTLRAITEMGKSHGVIAHRFYGTDGQVMVVDEWPDAESFQRFFEEAMPQIQPIMEAVGVTNEPTPTFWRKLETYDDVGWDA